MSDPATVDWRVEYLPLSDLLSRRHPENVKDHDLGSLIVSFDRLGFRNPGIINESDGTLLSGHGRYEALHTMKRQKYDCPDGCQENGDEWYAPVLRGISIDDPTEAHALRLALNRITELAGYTDELKIRLEEILSVGGEGLLVATGFDTDYMDDLIQRGKSLYESPEEFEEFDEDIDYDYECPKCQYRWSGAAK